MREVTMELFGSKWSFQVDDATADRLISAMQADNKNKPVA
jgi:hypothetical protein